MARARLIYSRLCARHRDRRLFEMVSRPPASGITARALARRGPDRAPRAAQVQLLRTKAGNRCMSMVRLTHAILSMSRSRELQILSRIVYSSNVSTHLFEERLRREKRFAHSTHSRARWQGK